MALSAKDEARANIVKLLVEGPQYVKQVEEVLNSAPTSPKKRRRVQAKPSGDIQKQILLKDNSVNINKINVKNVLYQKDFYCWDTEYLGKRDCCFNHIIGLPEKDGAIRLSIRHIRIMGT
jgi:hypothetical protein